MRRQRLQRQSNDAVAADDDERVGSLRYRGLRQLERVGGVLPTIANDVDAQLLESRHGLFGGVRRVPVARPSGLVSRVTREMAASRNQLCPGWGFRPGRGSA